MSGEAGLRKIIIPGNEWRAGVINELTELTERLVRLRQFMLKEDFFKLSELQANLLQEQSAAMCEYANILTQRLRS